MKPFQWIVVPLLAALAIRELNSLRQHSWRTINLIRFAVWSIAAILVGFPDLTVPLARLFGIERGVDLVVYCFILASATVSLSLYSRQDKLERKLVQMARERALNETRRGDGDQRESADGGESL